MVFWQKLRWSDASLRHEQLDDHITRTGTTRYGIRPVSETEKVRVVQHHFDRVAPKYDFMNSLLSMGIQHVWKRAAVRMMGLKPGDKVLDLCGGTGDLAILATHRIGPQGQVVIYDINLNMMLAGLPKMRPFAELSNIVHVQGDGERMAFGDNTFDAAMVGFGIRNFTHLKKGFSEMHRVLKPGGKVLCLEFSRSTNPIFRQLYDFYSFTIMPFLGGLITGSAQSYSCLPETIRLFPLPDELSAILEGIGFTNVRYQAMTNAIAVAHIGTKKR